MADFRDHVVTSAEALERIYGEPYGPSIAKETDRITPQYGAFIEAAPFFALATAGPDGLDCSPRGDAPGFVRIHDEKTLLVPDRPIAYNTRRQKNSFALALTRQGVAGRRVR